MARTAKFECCIRGYHVYRDWDPQVGECLMCEREPDNPFDRYAVAVKKNGEVIGHLPRKISRVCSNFLKEGGTIACTVIGGGERESSDLPQGGLEIPCFLTITGANIASISESLSEFYLPYKGDAQVDLSDINQWLKEGSVELKVTRVNMHGPPGAGKTCAQLLLLNEDPPRASVTDSTPIARSAVQATRVSYVGGKDVKWKRLSKQELLENLASDLKSTSVHAPKKPVDETNKEVLDVDMNDGDSSQSIEEPSDVTARDVKSSIIEDIVERIPHAKAQLSDHRVYIIDSGGQPAFQELLPLFVRTPSVNIITIDLSKGLDTVLEFQYRINGKIFKGDSNMKFTNKTFVEAIVRSRTVYRQLRSSPPHHQLSSGPHHPVYLVLGTRHDKISDSDLSEMNKMLESSYISKHVVKEKRDQSGNSVIFPVNTLLPAKSKKRRKAGRELCSVISKREGTSFTITLPIRWFAFELQLQKIAEDKQRSFLTKDEVLSEGKMLQMTNDDIFRALKYLHNATVILYFPDVLPNLVFVDPQPILEVLSRILALTYVPASSAHLIADPVPSEEDLDNLNSFGMFKMGLLDSFKSVAAVTPDDFIKLLMHLHIIAKVDNQKQGDYFLPCALPSYYSHLSPPSSQLEPLLLVWQEPGEMAECLPVPQGVFPLTIVHLLNQKDVRLSQSKESYKYRDAMSLRIGKAITLHIINKHVHMEFYVTGHGAHDQCTANFKLITEAIRYSIDKIRIEIPHKFAFRCPSKRLDCYCIVDVTRAEAICSCCSHDKNYINLKEERYSSWFQAMLSAAGTFKKNAKVESFVKRDQESQVNMPVIDCVLHESDQQSVSLTDSIENEKLTDKSVQFNYLVPFTDNIPWLIKINKRRLYTINGSDEQTLSWKAHGITIIIPKDALPPSVTSCDIAVVPIVEGNFIFPDNTTPVSAVYAIGVSCELAKPIRLSIQHCVKLTDPSDCAKLMCFAKAEHVGSSLPDEFEILSNGVFTVGSEYGTIETASFTLFSILRRKLSQLLSDRSVDCVDRYKLL